MVKMALSAMIRQVMPTTPLEGLRSALDSGGTAPVAAPLVSKGIVAVVAFIECSLMSFVFPIRVARVLDVPKRPATFNGDRKSTRLNSSHLVISYAVFC